MKIKASCAILFLVFTQACGSGDGENSNPIGLFENPLTNASVSLPEDGSVQDAMAMFDSPIGGAAVTVGLLSVSKAFSFLESPTCDQTNENTLDCTHHFSGPLGGPSTEHTVFVCENTEDGGSRCDLTIDSNFGGFSGPDRCGRTRVINGFFQCDLTVTGVSQSETTATDRFSGQCNTQGGGNEENLMTLDVEGRVIRVGFDLGVEFEQGLQSGDRRLVFLRDMNLRGTTSVNGVSYPFEELKNIDLDQCP